MKDGKVGMEVGNRRLGVQALRGFGDDDELGGFRIASGHEHSHEDGRDDEEGAWRRRCVGALVERGRG
jgi:hypothetical protein